MMKRRADARVGIAGDSVKRQVNAFFEQTFDPRQVLLGQSRRKLAPGLKEEVEKKKIHLDESWVTFSKNFDVMEWWETVGKISFPLIYAVAILILPLPDSNGNQERTFSAATWMDGKLKKRQSNLTFEMKVLLYKNHDFLKRHLNNYRLDKLREAEERTREVLNSRASIVSASSSDADDSDNEYEQEEEDLMWEAYEMTVDDDDNSTGEGSVKTPSKSPLTSTPTPKEN